jgi:hypothetical protein
MIRAEYNKTQKIRPIDLIVHGIYNTMTIPEALELIGIISSAINDAIADRYPPMQKIYGPGTTPTFIPQQTNITIPNVEIKTQGTQRTEQPYKINSEKSDMEQEFI